MIQKWMRHRLIHHDLCLFIELVSEKLNESFFHAFNWKFISPIDDIKLSDNKIWKFNNYNMILIVVFKYRLTDNLEHVVAVVQTVPINTFLRVRKIVKFKNFVWYVKNMSKSIENFRNHLNYRKNKLCKTS